MKELMLIRHAKASSPQDVPDHDRPLSAEGEAAAPEVGRRLAAAGAVPDRIVSSDARRARATAMEIARAFGLSTDVVVLEPQLYDAGVRDIAGIAAGLDDALDRVALVGHNPTMQESVACLCDFRPDKLPAAGVVRIALPIARWRDLSGGAGECIDFDYPEKEPASE